MEEKIYHGFITYYTPEKHFGFIDSEAGENLYFYFDTSPFKNLPAKERKEVRKYFLKGDEVHFKIKTTEKGIEAYDLQFIKNERTVQLLQLLTENEILPGYLKKIHDRFYVKDIATYLFLPLSVSQWEVDVDEVYEQRINQLVYYLTPEKAERIDKVKAKLADRRWSEDYTTLKEYQQQATKIPAIITGKNKDGYFATILNRKVSTFIPFNKNETMPELKKWQEVDVIIYSLHENGIRIQLADS